MAGCRFSATVGDSGDMISQACNVHCHYAPCPHDGEPAVPEPMHCDERPTAAAAIDYARQVTGGYRPIVVHRGSWADRGHEISETCPCQPTFLDKERS